MSAPDDTRDARVVRGLMHDFERERVPREGDPRAIELALAAVLRARAPTDSIRADSMGADGMRQSGERWSPARRDRGFGDDVPNAGREPRIAAAVPTPGPQPAIQVIRRPAPPLAPMSRIAIAAAAVLGVAIGAGAVAGGGVVVATIERERAIAEEVERSDELAGTIAPVSTHVDVDHAPAIAVARFAAARELLAHPVTSHRASRWLVTARDALDEDDPELAERVLRMIVRRWPRGYEAGTARLALAEIYAATDRPREGARELERWLFWNRRADRAPAIESRIVALRERY